MKILVFEYITGGGFNNQEMPEPLANEGRFMLGALLDCFSEIKNVELTVMLDWRLSKSINTNGINTLIVTPEHHTLNEFERLSRQCDAVWPVAPEFDGILLGLCQKVESLNKILLTPPSLAVTMAGNKFETFKQLSQHNITTVDTMLFEDSRYSPGEWIVKRVDGAGCDDSYLLTGRRNFALLSKQLSGNRRYIIQPYIHGEKTSLSCLFKQGRGWLLCVNLQRFTLITGQYRLIEIVVNHNSDFDRYEGLVNNIAMAFPHLWGYAGIDLIETAEDIKVLEINPRLTTSFAGIQAARGINACRCVLDLLKGDPVINAQCNKPITINVKQDEQDI